jgi:hypothetical protein
MRRDTGARSERQTVELLGRVAVLPVVGSTLVDAAGALREISVVLPPAARRNREREQQLKPVVVDFSVAVYWHRVVLRQFIACLYSLLRGNHDVPRIVQQLEGALQLVSCFPMLFRPGMRAGSREIDQGEAGCLCYRIGQGRVEIVEMRVQEKEG